MTISVTQVDINIGTLGDCSACPIALALKRQFPGQPVEVGGSWARIGGSTYRLPFRAQAFVANFDGGIMVPPFTFELGAPVAPEEDR